jgi:hypothetical protein
MGFQNFDEQLRGKHQRSVTVMGYHKPHAALRAE